MRHYLVIDHHATQNDGRNSQIDQTGGCCCCRNDEPWEVDFLDKCGVIDHRVAGIGKSTGIVLPKKEPHIEKDRIWCVVAAADVGHPIKDEGKDDHRNKRLKYCPENPQCSLLVAHGNVAPSQHQKKIPVSPQFLPVD